MNKKELTAILSLKDRLSPQMKGIQGRLKVFGNEVKRLARVGFLALAAAITAVSVALTKMVKDTVAYGVQLDKVSKQMGITTEEMSKLQYAAEQEQSIWSMPGRAWRPILASSTKWESQSQKPTDT